MSRSRPTGPDVPAPPAEPAAAGPTPEVRAAERNVEKAVDALRKARAALRAARKAAAARRRQAILDAVVAAAAGLPADYDIGKVGALLKRVAERKIPHDRLAALIETPPADAGPAA